MFVDSAVTNVLDNAVTHTPDGTRIRVGACDAAPARVRLTVEDDGPGVPDADLPRLFERFSHERRQASGPRTSREGIGIGLAVARGLVEATGGTVAARRSDLGGIAIDIELPSRVRPASGPAG